MVGGRIRSEREGDRDKSESLKLNFESDNSIYNALNCTPHRSHGRMSLKRYRDYSGAGFSERRHPNELGGLAWQSLAMELGLKKLVESPKTLQV